MKYLIPALSLIIVLLNLCNAATRNSMGTSCGKTKVNLRSPEYLAISEYLFALELPKGWGLDSTHKNPYYFILKGESYDSAKTLIYINIERLQDSFNSSISKDSNEFQTSCPSAKIINLKTTNPLKRLRVRCPKIHLSS